MGEVRAPLQNSQGHITLKSTIKGNKSKAKKRQSVVDI